MLVGWIGGVKLGLRSFYDATADYDIVHDDLPNRIAPGERRLCVRCEYGEVSQAVSTRLVAAPQVERISRPAGGAPRTFRFGPLFPDPARGYGRH